MKNGLVIWFTGLSGSGKTTIANHTKEMLSFYYHIYNVIILDGDEIRSRLNKDLDFSDNDRTENIRRIAEIANLLKNNGIIVIVATISPHKTQRELAKSIIGKESFIEVFIDANITTCQTRDVKGLYKKAKNGEIKDFTGISSLYEIPKKADVILSTDYTTIDHCSWELIDKIREELYR